MRLLRCRKCGTVITTHDTMVENMMNEVNRLNRLAEKAAKSRDKALVNVYQQQSKQVSTLMRQLIHLHAQRDEQFRREKNEKRAIVRYILDNNLVSEEKIRELEALGRKRAAEQDDRDRVELERLYGDFESTLTNRTKNDPTAKEAMRKRV